MTITNDWDDVVDDDAVAATVTASPRPPRPYQVLTCAAIVTQRQALIDRVAESLGVDHGRAESLLRTHRWRADAVVDAFLDDDNAAAAAIAPTTADDDVLCGTAFCGRHPKAATTALACGHAFCNDCWRALAASAMASGRVVVNMRCPGADCDDDNGAVRKCQMRIPSGVFAAFLGDDGVQAEKYRRWLIDDFVNGSESLRWCIRPSCDHVIASANPNEVVTCHCRTTFCFGCAIGDHHPAPCDLARKWLARVTSDSETEKWIRSRTKKCPKCRIPIEKNRACNHMICANCSAHFCWLCKMPWSNHDVEQYGFYRCNLYEAGAGQYDADPDSVEAVMATQQMQKYTFYLNRHVHQVQAEKEVVALSDLIEEDRVNVEFRADRVLPVLQQLIRARRFLAWSYCLAYYLRAGPRKRLLEHQQGVLESIAEQLQSALTMTRSAPSSSSKSRREKKPPSGERPRPSESDIVRLGAAVHHFATRLCQQLLFDQNDGDALSEADDHADRWACTVCTAEAGDDADYCALCGACRAHSEQECRAPRCRNPTTPDVLTPGEAIAAIHQRLGQLGD